MPPARVIAIFDWELSTIGDPLADLGYLTVTWVQPGDPEDTMFSSLSAVTRREGFPTRDELIAHYEERTGRSMSDLRWYQALALWKAAVFMEGNYKRSLAGTTDDPYLKMFDEGVPALAEAAHEVSACRLRTARLTGLLVDYGGVLTTNVWDSFRAFCEAEGIDREEVKRAFRDRPGGDGAAAPAGGGRADRGGVLAAVRPDHRRARGPPRGSRRPAVRGHAARGADDRGAAPRARRPA